MSQSDQLKGVGGWLAFLILGLCVLHPLIGVMYGLKNFQAVEQLNPSVVSSASWLMYKQAAWCLFAVISLLRLAAGLMLLFLRRPSAVRFTLVVLWLCPLISAAGEHFLFTQNLGSSVGSAHVSALLIQLVKGWSFAAIWSAYLVQSVRVRNTYGAHPNNSFKPKPLRGSA